MTLKEELEILRGEPIEVRTVKPEDIPCIETSDAEKLCKNPVVSVNMITYNHEPYIRQAIEGVMMQKTNFEFELIIGEDCSQDKTREICFEYQKKYPDKIRVLWWHENVSKLGGNSRRVMARCRGEFIALCEGDDYWIDPLKLQKQVDVMRSHSDVGFCFCGAEIYNELTGIKRKWDAGRFTPGKMPGEIFLDLHYFSSDKNDGPGPETFIMTATTLFRKSVYEVVLRKYEIFSWFLLLGDTTLWSGLSSLSNVYFLVDETALYRIGRGGVTVRRGARVSRDGVIVRVFFVVMNKLIERQRKSKAFECLVLTHLIMSQACLKKSQQIINYFRLLKNDLMKDILERKHNFLIRYTFCHGWIRSGSMLVRYIHYRNHFLQKLINRIKRK